MNKVNDVYYCQVYFRKIDLCCTKLAEFDVDNKTTKRCIEHRDIPMHIPAIPEPGENVTHIYVT